MVRGGPLKVKSKNGLLVKEKRLITTGLFEQNLNSNAIIKNLTHNASIGSLQRVC